MRRKLQKAPAKYRKNSVNGFLMSEMLMAMMIISFLIPTAVLYLRLIGNALDFNEEVQDETAAVQLRRILSLSYDIEVSADMVKLEYFGRDMMLVFRNNHVYLTPGTQIFFSDVEQAWFSSDSQMIYAHILRHNRENRYVIAITS